MSSFEVKSQYDIHDFISLVSFLRSDNGCPWDKVQTHASIKRNLIEEAYELAEALEQNDIPHMKEELGDVLMQVLFHTDIEANAGHFDLNDVCNHACTKLVQRHPNLFGEKTDLDWDQIKRLERGEATVSSEMDDVARSLPSLWRAEKIQKKAAKIGYDWPDVSDALAKVEEEVQELREGIAACDQENIIEELGDLIFAAVDAARILGVDAELAVHGACEKAIRRFRSMEQEAAAIGKGLEEMTLSEMEELHQKARVTLEGKEPDYSNLERFQKMQL